MATKTLDEQINDFKKNMVTSPPSKDHVIDLKLDGEKIKTLDKNGEELCRLSFKVDDRLVHFQMPAWGKYPAFLQKRAELIVYFSRFAGDLYIEEKFQDVLKDETYKHLVSSAIVSAPRFAELIMDLFFYYLDVKIDGIELLRNDKWDDETYYNKHIEHQKKWFKLHCRVDQIFYILTICTHIDEIIKKKADQEIQRIVPHQHSKAKSSKPGSAKNPVSTESDSIPTQSSSFVLF
jgi:hypothetical protein